MNQAFCQCGRSAEWPEKHPQALCRCGRIIEPMTAREVRADRMTHDTRILYLELLNDVFRL